MLIINTNFEIEEKEFRFDRWKIRAFVSISCEKKCYDRSFLLVITEKEEIGRSRGVETISGLRGPSAKILLEIRVSSSNFFNFFTPQVIILKLQ